MMWSGVRLRSPAAQVAQEQEAARESSGSPEQPIIISEEEEDEEEEEEVVRASSRGSRQRLASSTEEDEYRSKGVDGQTSHLAAAAAPAATRRRTTLTPMTRPSPSDRPGPSGAACPRSRNPDSGSAARRRRPSGRQRGAEDTRLAALQLELNPPRRSRARVSYAETAVSEGEEGDQDTPGSPGFQPEQLGGSESEPGADDGTDGDAG
ncbi:hypothetical protein FJT64_013854 [Amphibalanus amphitrite]|uniref:Uncharacterized protein n=1 Tax=Amphibalanus amphitrite TaxID=1232801 RepID=A0A6A4V2A9_AMPAM|nr:hypothetical protein FJT64_013854 [Amphibalanus amphitrite]